MPRHFLRFVPSLRESKDNGTDEHFYRGELYKAIPSEFHDALRRFCGENLASIEIGSEDKDDEPISVYALRVGDAPAEKALASLKTSLAEALKKVIGESASKIAGGNFERHHEDASAGSTAEESSFTKPEGAVRTEGAGSEPSSVDAPGEPSAEKNRSGEPNVDEQVESSVFSRDLDDAFDALRGAAELRDYILRIEGEIERIRKAGNETDAALLIEV